MRVIEGTEGRRIDFHAGHCVDHPCRQLGLTQPATTDKVGI